MPADAAANPVSLGFDEPVHDSQRTFRQLLTAFSRPGTIVELTGKTNPGAGLALGVAATAVALTLVDLETPVWLADEYQGVADYLRFHCGARIVTDPGLCRFAFAVAGGPLPDLQGFDLGNAEFPDRSTTLILEVGSLQGAAGAGGLALSGPGIQHKERIDISGVDADFWRQRAELRPLFPLGLDVVLTCGSQMAALPRTTLVEA